MSDPAQEGLRAAAVSLALNVCLAGVKIAAGVIGNSYALVADGIESCADVVSTLIVWGGIRISRRPPDRTHPYGHGKAESIAAVFVASILVAAAVLIAVRSAQEIATPHHAPAPFTLPVLVAVVVVKEGMFRFLSRTGRRLRSSSLATEAWHHRSDALTSIAAFVGISLALIGGEGWEAADDWAALVACAVIAWNGIRLLRPALDEVMDAAVPAETVEEIRALAAEVDGVVLVEKCRVRKSGLGYLMDVHVQVDPEVTVRDGHAIGHRVVDRLKGSPLPILDVIVHVEPAETEGEAAGRAGRPRG